MTDNGPMKILKIENHTGQFWDLSDESWVPIDQIDKETLMALVDLSLDCDVDIEKFDEKKLNNPAHQIIYKSISQKLVALSKQRDKFKDECDRTYLDAIRKYAVEEPGD